MGELTLWQKIRWKLRERAKKPLRENIWDLLTSWPKIKYRLREYRQRSVRTTINSFGLFDGDWYLLNNADVRISGADPLTHYMRHGFAEGRSPGPNGIAPAAFRATRFGHPDQAGSGKPLGDEAIQEIAMASLFEPSIGDFRQISHTLMPPDHDPVAKAERAMRALIPADHYDTILCVPWLRQGGADLVASLMAASLLRIFPQQSVLILRTDFSHFERPDWIPEGTTVVDISPILTPIGIEAAERLLYSLFIGLAPRRIVNINSRRCWTTLKRFGRFVLVHIAQGDNPATRLLTHGRPAFLDSKPGASPAEAHHGHLQLFVGRVAAGLATRQQESAGGCARAKEPTPGKSTRAKGRLPVSSLTCHGHSSAPCQRLVG